MDELVKNRELLLKGVHTLGIVCNQWGDTGKGKFVDFFADWADIIARGTGGANAGHTISLNNKTYIFHLTPSGILHDKEGKINIIGSGTAIDPKVVADELEILKKEGLSYDNLFISQNAHLVLPQHLVMDRAKEIDSNGKIGTTGRGIGPAYEDHYARIGLKMNDILNKDVFVQKLKRNLRDKIKFLKTIDPEAIKKIMDHPHLGNGRFYDPEVIFNVEEIAKAFEDYAKIIGIMIKDTDNMVREALGKKNILLEGAQGALLSIDIGTYPYVTSSDCSIGALAKGVGLRESDVDLNLGIVKAFYMTRVGEGPFPTEMGGNASAEWSGAPGANKTTDKEKFGSPSVNEKDENLQGVGIRMSGDEYGATTGRPRRVGWLDLPLLRHSMTYNGKNTILTKLDVLDDCDEIKICVAYKYTGPDYQLADMTFKTGAKIETAILDDFIFSKSKPIYRTFPGWKSSISTIKSFNELPQNLRLILDFIMKETGMNPRIISVGPNRDETIVVPE